MTSNAIMDITIRNRLIAVPPHSMGIEWIVTKMGM
jgi:hypothetical protein